MTTKLTLTIDKPLIEKAKRYAKSQGRSLSDIVQNYLRAITSEDHKTTFDKTPVSSTMKGAFKAPENFDYKEELSKALTEKYL